MVRRWQMGESQRAIGRGSGVARISPRRTKRCLRGRTLTLPGVVSGGDKVDAIADSGIARGHQGERAAHARAQLADNHFRTGDDRLRTAPWPCEAMAGG